MRGTAATPVTTFEYHVAVEWGDCDPAGIVFYPNFYRWMDQATYHLFHSVNLGWNELRERFGAPGLPLISAQATFRSPCRFGDSLQIEAFVSQWGTKSLTVSHTIRNRKIVAVEGWEKRVWSVGDPESDGRIRPAPIPAAVRAAFA